ncbi:unnamed protein product, partial [Sphacelaria rigidula]
GRNNSVSGGGGATTTATIPHTARGMVGASVAAAESVANDHRLRGSGTIEQTTAGRVDSDERGHSETGGQDEHGIKNNGASGSNGGISSSSDGGNESSGRGSDNDREKHINTINSAIISNGVVASGSGGNDSDGGSE